MTFKKRIQTGLDFETELFQKLSDIGFKIAMNGTEHTHPEFVDGLRNSTDQTSLSLRFQPDGVISIGKIPRSVFIEAKASKAIEKLAYIQYLKLKEMGSIVVVVFKVFGNGWCFIEDMPIIDGNKTVESFPEGRRFPVEDGWIVPRKCNRKPKNGSGTPYREINSFNLNDWCDFKKIIIEKLMSNF